MQTLYSFCKHISLSKIDGRISYKTKASAGLSKELLKILEAKDKIKVESSYKDDKKFTTYIQNLEKAVSYIEMLCTGQSSNPVCAYFSQTMDKGIFQELSERLLPEIIRTSLNIIDQYEHNTGLPTTEIAPTILPATVKTSTANLPSHTPEVNKELSTTTDTNTTLPSLLENSL